MAASEIEAALKDAWWAALMGAVHTGTWSDLKWFNLYSGLVNATNCRNEDELVALIKETWPLPTKDYVLDLKLTEADRKKIVEHVNGSCLSDAAKAQVRRVLGGS